MGERGQGIRDGVNKQGWEKADFPILCETCLGDNPYVRMSRSEFGRECKVCQRPFTVFRWKPGSKLNGDATRFKKTEICQTCAKLKNVCQTCIFDLDFGLPVEIRDKFIDKTDHVVMPTEVANKDFWAHQMNANVDKLDLPYNKPELKEALAELAKSNNGNIFQGIGGAKAAKRNAAHVCSFFVRGECKRGAACPYRHTDITDQDLERLKKGNGSIDDKIRERYSGLNDPIAKKIMEKFDAPKAPAPPNDLTITTLFLGGVTPDMTQMMVSDALADFGPIAKIKLESKNKRGFVCFGLRDSAEAVMNALHANGLQVGGEKVKVLWAKGQLSTGEKKQTAEESKQ